MAAGNKALHHQLNLYTGPDTYVFEPVESSSITAFGGIEKSGHDRQTLEVDRRTGDITLNPAVRGAPLGPEKVMAIYGIMGMISLATSDFLVLITARVPVARLLSHDIYQATEFKLLPISLGSSSAFLLSHPVESRLLSIVETGLRNLGGQLLFSYGWDLTNSLERQYRQERAAPPGKGIDYLGGIGERADDRFFWNKHMMNHFMEFSKGNGSRQDLSRFSLPVLFGSFALHSCTINSKTFLFGLISRRSRHRAGTRFFSRGIDQDGNTSNYNETEQIILYDPPPANLPGRVEGKEQFSYVQVRGSAPVFWAQINNLRYTPDLQVMDLPETESALRAHLTEQIALYGPVILINLINSHGYEKPIKEAVETALIMVGEPKARYEYFDFHGECKGMRYDRINSLFDRLREDLDAQGYFHSGIKTGEKNVLPEPRRLQKSVVRSNCMDSLDRTNVVQSALAKRVLQSQLQECGILSPSESIDSHAAFMWTFRNVWADHADAVSNAYSFTGALKTDFTRTGKRTKQGALVDGWRSIKRYAYGNFFDGQRQDAYDLLTGAFVMRKGSSTQFSDVRPPITKVMPWVLFISSLVLLSVLLVGNGKGGVSIPVAFFWICVVFMSFYYIWGNGIEYVAWPHLNPPHELLNYEGPGYSSKKRGRGQKLPFISAAPANVRQAFERAKRTGSLLAVSKEEVELKKKGRAGRLD